MSNAKQISNNSLSQTVERYLTYFASGSSHTARAKRLDLNHFLMFLAEHRGHGSVSKLKVRDWDFSSVQAFIEASLARGEAPATISRRLATLKHMGRTFSETVPDFVNPARQVRAPKIPSLKPKGISSAELDEIRSKAARRLGDKPSFIRLRNQTIFEFLLDTGIRADEVRLLRMTQLDPNLEWIQNVRTKGRRFRNVYITSAMRPTLMRYLEARSKELLRFFSKVPQTLDRKLPLFISNYKANAQQPDTFLMGAKSLWRAIHELSVEEGLHPHLLRHSYALDLLDESNDVRLVAQALGHSDVRVTMRYTERGQEEVAKALERSRGRTKKG